MAVFSITLLCALKSFNVFQFNEGENSHDPLPKGTYHSTPKKYAVKIDESGTNFTEKISIDLDRNLVDIEVPHHNDVAASHIIHDYEKVSVFFAPYVLRGKITSSTP